MKISRKFLKNFMQFSENFTFSSIVEEYFTQLFKKILSNFPKNFTQFSRKFDSTFKRILHNFLENFMQLFKENFTKF